MIASILKNYFSKVNLTIVIVVIVALLTVIYLAERGCSTISQIAENFKTGKVVTEFHDYVTEVKGLQRLQVASLKTTDVFTRVDSKSILWELFDLPDVKIEIKLPVEYTYYVDLKDKWNFEWDENLMHIKVIAPAIKPNTPAVDISEMRVTILKESYLRDVDAVKDSLFKELMPSLNQLAYEKINLIKETARKETSEFVSNWFIQTYFKEYNTKPKLISVYFVDEVSLTRANESTKTVKEER
jgi:hypothetical protein